jgi:hypothetical protein
VGGTRAALPDGNVNVIDIGTCWARDEEISGGLEETPGVIVIEACNRRKDAPLASVQGLTIHNGAGRIDGTILPVRR